MPLKIAVGTMYPWVTHTHTHLGGSTVQECFESAIRLVRKHHPYAKVHEVA